MNKIDPKLLAPKVVPIDRVQEEYDEPQTWPEPQLQERDLMQALCCGVAAVTICATCLLLLL